LKPTHPVFVCLLISAVFSAAQNAPQAQTPEAGQSAQQPAANTAQTPQQTAPPAAQPSAEEPAPPPSQAPDQAKGTDQAAKPPDQAKESPATKKDEKTTSGTSNDRLFFALPNFLTVDKNGNIIPLTAGQKFKVVARGAFDPVQIPWYGILSAIGQAENSEPGYGQGWGAYGKRFATYAADGTIENFFVGAIFPSILHQDPRFFPKPEGSFFSRAGYAVSRIVITRSDSGKREFNFSEVFGSAMASAISTYSYHPRRAFKGLNSMGVPEYYASDRTLSNTASVWVSQMGYDAITIALKEFWPDIRKKFKK
jgi:hypothetical protein